MDKVVPQNPCKDTRLPKMPTQRVRAKRRRIVTPEEYAALRSHLSPMALLLSDIDIETGARPGEVFALRLGRVDRAQRLVRIEQVLIEVSKKDSPTGERFIFKDLPKDDEPRAVRISGDLTEAIYAYADEHGIGPDDLLFTSKRGGPLSRSNFRNREWRPAVEASGLDFFPTVRDLRHAHASWAVNGGADHRPSGPRAMFAVTTCVCRCGSPALEVRCRNAADTNPAPSSCVTPPLPRRTLHATRSK